MDSLIRRLLKSRGFSILEGGGELELPSTLHTRSPIAYTLWLSFWVPGVQLGLGLCLHSSCLDWRMNPRCYGQDWVQNWVPFSSFIGMWGRCRRKKLSPSSEHPDVGTSWLSLCKLTLCFQLKFYLVPTWVPSLGWEGPLEKGKATHSSILAWRTPWTVYLWGHKESDTTERLSLSPSNWLSGELFLPVCPVPLEESCTALVHQGC